MRDIGNTIKEIRIMKGIKPTSMKGISRSTLSNIENKKSVPTLENLKLILENFSMTENEFFYRHNNYQLSEHEQLIQEFRQINQSSETEKILQLQEKYKAYLKANPEDTTIKDFMLLLKTYQEIQRKNTFLIENEDSHALYDTLIERAKRGEWTFLETYIASRIFYCFPLERAEELINLVQDSLLKYTKMNNERRFQSGFLFNCGHYFFELKQYKRAKDLLINAQNYSKVYQEASTFLGASFVLLQIDYIEKKEARPLLKKQIERLIDGAKILEYSGLAVHLEKDFRLLEEKYK
ncbi:helix-turn-helix domain-containing protein [Listeria booriae]|uniref:Helix-turn-helix transcriptional regulator n=1 Tax=Listeria booriae TaxID=1552123 RepID=A0A841Y316_9LIST|nr:helix-turn-helix transcriptional regulator [Listeria booriae]MBC1318461.1 helix-turn-helix transcriptional regulator [Listeria booriae]